MTQREALDYEISGAWWPEKITNPFLQGIAAKIIASRVNRKWARYQKLLAIREWIKTAPAFPK